MKKKTNFCSIIRAIGRESNGDAGELSLELFWESFRGEIMSKKMSISCWKVWADSKTAGGVQSAAFQISRAPKLPAFRPGAVGRGVPMLDLR